MQGRGDAVCFTPDGRRFAQVENGTGGGRVVFGPTLPGRTAMLAATTKGAALGALPLTRRRAMFADRREAGEALAGEVAARGFDRPVVLALPRGGVPVAAPVAERLGAPLGLLLVRKLGVPGHEELAAGAVGGGDPPVTVFNESVLAMIGMAEEDFSARVAEKLAEISERRALYLAGRPDPEVVGRTAIVIDDGIATGATVKAALGVLKARRPGRIVLAVPVAPREALREMAELADEIVCLQTPEPFVAVGAHYHAFPQTTDAEVVAILRAAGRREVPPAAPS